MKLLLAFTLVAVVLMVESARVKRCKSSDVCEDDQCCAGKTPFSGKCVPLSGEGKPCKTNEMIYPYPFADEVYIQLCPCADGLECVAVETTGTGKTKHDGFCQAPTTEAPATEAPTTPGDETSGGSGEVSEEPAEVSEEPAEVSEEPAEVSEEPVEVSQEPAEVSQEPAEVSQEPAEVSEAPVEEESQRR